MFNHVLFVGALSLCLSAPCALGQGPVEYQMAEQYIDVSASVRNLDNSGGPGDTSDDERDQTLTLPGQIQGDLSASVSSQGNASTIVSITMGSVDDSATETRGRITSIANRGSGYSASAGGGYSLSTQFSVSEATSGALSGFIDIGRPSGGAGSSQTSQAFVTIVFVGFTPPPTPAFISYSYTLGLEPSGLTRIEFSEFFDVAPGGTYSLGVTAANNAFVEPGTDPTEELTIEWNCSLIIGDRDEDGLLDKWETDGIDTDGDGTPEINLPAMGADPDHKDIFLEIDTLSGSAAVPASVLASVRAAFANAPVSNPSGQNGITLHTFVDESNLPATAYVQPPNAQVAALKSNWFGSNADRMGGRWMTEIRPARLKVFRYCIWGGSQENGSSGWGEIPGDDFIVTLDPATFPNINNNDRAGTLMHELGHTLGLRHGGGDDIGYKPNYLSVMNYSFQFESTLNPIYNAWSLDFSCDELPTINEGALDEMNGFDASSAYANRYTVFNTTTAGPIRVEYDVLESGPVDFNQDGVFSSGTVAADLNRVIIGQSASTNQTLRGFNDWDSVNLRFAGSANYGAGVSGGMTTANSGPELTGDDYAQLASSFGGGSIPCAADLTGDGNLNFFDVSAFLVGYGAMDPIADFTGDGVFNFFDVSAFLTAYIDGCP